MPRAYARDGADRAIGGGLGIAAAGYILAQVPWFQARMPFRSVQKGGIRA